MADNRTWTARQTLRTKARLYVYAPVIVLLLITILTAGSAWMIGVSTLVAAASLSMTSWWLSVGPYGFHYRFIFGYPRRTVPCSDITSVKVVKINTWNWGGWGRSWNYDGTGLVTGRGPGIRITRTNGKIIEASCQDEEEAALAANVLEAHLHR